MIDKLKSRKLWLCIIGCVLVLVLKQIGIPDNIIEWAVGTLLAFVGVEGILDLAGILKSVKKK